jgi:RNA polymerase sigma-70 factor, ECF subfamily
MSISGTSFPLRCMRALFSEIKVSFTFLFILSYICNFVLNTRPALKNELLTAGLERRDKVVFDYVFNYYYSSLCAFSMQYLNDRSSVEDLVQEFFVSLWLDAPRHSINSSLKSYLFAAVRNRCLDFHKHQEVVKKHRSLILLSNPEEDNSADHFMAESELRHSLETCLGKLPPRCREIFELSRLKGLSNQEIASELGLSKRTVELQISNALKILRMELVEYLPVCLIAMLLV